MKNVKLLSKISVIFISCNIFAMDSETVKLGCNIASIFEKYRATYSNSGLIKYNLEKGQGLKIISQWENLDSVYSFFRSPAHHELKALFGLPLKPHIDIDIQDKSKPVRVENTLIDNTFTIQIKNL